MIIAAMLLLETWPRFLEFSQKLEWNDLALATNNWKDFLLRIIKKYAFGGL